MNSIRIRSFVDLAQDPCGEVKIPSESLSIEQRILNNGNLVPIDPRIMTGIAKAALHDRAIALQPDNPILNGDIVHPLHFVPKRSDSRFDLERAYLV